MTEENILGDDQITKIAAKKIISQTELRLVNLKLMYNIGEMEFNIQSRFLK